jgi:hypothetical protein
LHIVNSALANQLRVSNTTADATTKYGTVLGSHYTNSEEPITGMLLTSSSSSTGGSVSIGGGISSANAVNTIKFYTAANNTTLTGTERARLDTSGNWMVGKTSVGVATTGSEMRADGQVSVVRDSATPLYVNRKSTDGVIIDVRKDNTTVGSIGTYAGDLTIGDDDVGIRFDTGTGLVPWDLGATSTGGSATDATIDIGASTARFKDLRLGGVAYISDGTSSGTQTVVGGNYYIANSGAYPIVFQTGGSERARLDASGNLLVGTTSADTTGSQLRANGQVRGNSTAIPVFANRIGSSGVNIRLQNNSTTAGGIGTHASTTFIYGTGGGVTDTGLIFSNGQIVPCNGSGVGQDDVFDLGTGTSRFDDVFATNGTINTSDGDEKQDIEELTEAEHRVAVAVKGLLRKFRWKSRVEEKGDDARIHFGIIAQDLQAAFEAEGLDAGRYAMFINSTWTDEETGEERSRMGVRYNELLAFIIAAI